MRDFIEEHILGLLVSLTVIVAILLSETYADEDIFKMFNLK